jgi:hypothetical protein
MQHGFSLAGADRAGDLGGVPDIDPEAPAHEALMPGGEVVHDDRPIAGAMQRLAGMRPDIAGATGNENRT